MAVRKVKVPPSAKGSGTQRRTMNKPTHGVRVTSSEGGINRAVEVNRHDDNGFSLHLETHWGDDGPPTITRVGLSWQAMDMLVQAYAELVNDPDRWKIKTGTALKTGVEDK